MSDLLCPRCGRESPIRLPVRGVRMDYKCGSCGLAFSISVLDVPVIRTGRPARLIQGRNRVWLRPIGRRNLS
jgi:DNA-directed RNA polymerase subunit RPC12/RpoP